MPEDGEKEEMALVASLEGEQPQSGESLTDRKKRMEMKI
jgi:hypothetical protein